MIISIVNNKGGVGKTTTAVNLGHALSRKKKKVLVIDMDSQCNATDLLLSSGKIIATHTLYDLLYDILEDTSPPSIKDCIKETEYQNLFVLPNIIDTATLEPEMMSKLPDSLFALREVLRQYALENFDFTFFDTPPNMGTFVMSSLYASDFIIVPTEAGSKFSSEGLIRAVDLISDVQRNGNPDLRFLKLLLTKVDKRTIVSTVVVEKIRQLFATDKVFETEIPRNTDLQKSELFGKTIYKYRSNASSAIAYSNVANELINISDKIRS